MKFILIGTIVVPLIGICLLVLLPDYNLRAIRKVALNTSLVTFLMTILLWVTFNSSLIKFQFVEKINWMTLLDIDCFFGVDGLSLFFIILTSFLVMICILTSYQSILFNTKEFLICFLILDCLLISVFSTLDIFYFYIFFEGVLIPMYLIIGIWGSRKQKIRAAYQFFIYTLIGSIIMLVGILVIFSHTGSTNIHILYLTDFSHKRQLLVWLSFLCSFAVKVPMIPVHIWLPEAHVEAPTSGSIILAGILLKLGIYGFLRFSIPLFPFATLFFVPLIYTLSVIAILYASLTTLRQIDLKKMIAYSSVAHMNFVTAGVFALNIQGIEGAIILMLSHGIVSSALFYCVGVLYDRYHTRLIRYYGSLVNTMPLFAIVFLFFTIANMSFPGTSSFIGELLILIGIFKSNTFVALLAGIGTIFAACYCIWLYNRIVYGFTLTQANIHKASDLSRLEFVILITLVFITIFVGFKPDYLLDNIHVATITTLEYLQNF